MCAMLEFGPVRPPVSLGRGTYTRRIHPPVLADRGLAAAAEALAPDSPLRIHLASDLDPGRAGRPA